MKYRWLVVPAFLVLSLLAAAPWHPVANGKVGVVVGQARRQLTAEWDAQPVGNLEERERAYCVTSYSTFRVPGTNGDTLTIQIVSDLEAALVDSATRWGIRFKCRAGPHGERMPTVHTHPATRCNPSLGLCVADSTQMTPAGCGPSRIDMTTVAQLQLPFAIVQCAREVWTFYSS